MTIGEPVHVDPSLSNGDAAGLLEARLRGLLSGAERGINPPGAAESR
jgi:hypothetical protein